LGTIALLSISESDWGQSLYFGVETLVNSGSAFGAIGDNRPTISGWTNPFLRKSFGLVLKNMENFGRK
jgi:hypothetical protein